MKVSIVGAGYVGLVTGGCLADLGHQVMCVDNDAQKVATLNAAGLPIYEPGLQELMARNRAEGRIQFTTDMAQAVEHGEVIFIAVGTPSREDGSADLQHVLAVASQIGRHLKKFKVIVNKSTVPVGTAYRVQKCLEEELQKRGIQESLFEVISNPEFLKEGAAIKDFMHPDRIVIGLDQSPNYQKVHQKMELLYSSFNRHHARTIWMDVRSAELTKYAANAMLATRISFMNELANLSETLGTDIEQVRKGIGSDPRIGYHFLYPGAGYGGSCFPKDVQALMRTGQSAGHTLRILQAVEEANAVQKHRLSDKLIAMLAAKNAKSESQSLAGCTIALWGLAFKPNTDDMREAPARVVIDDLVARGARVQAYDPVAMPEAKKTMADIAGLSFADSPMAALQGADVLAIITEWKEFRSPDFAAIRAALKRPVIIDGRNLYDPAVVVAEGLEYHPIGRPVERPATA